MFVDAQDGKWQHCISRAAVFVGIMVSIKKIKGVTPVKIRQPFSRDGLGLFLRRFEWKV